VAPAATTNDTTSSIGTPPMCAITVGSWIPCDRRASLSSCFRGLGGVFAWRGSTGRGQAVTE
jgi:hypothetical protein